MYSGFAQLFITQTGVKCRSLSATSLMQVLPSTGPVRCILCISCTWPPQPTPLDASSCTLPPPFLHPTTTHHTTIKASFFPLPSPTINNIMHPFQCTSSPTSYATTPSHAQPHPHHRSKGCSCHPRHRDAEISRSALAEAEGEALRAEGDGLVDGGVDALAVDDVEVCEVVLIIKIPHGSASGLLRLTIVEGERDLREHQRTYKSNYPDP